MDRRIYPVETTFVAVFDIDGTLADNTHRRHFVERVVGKKDWKSFNNSMAKDTPNKAIVSILHAAKDIGLTTVLATGRGEEYREVTEKWLADNFISYDLLFMRPAKDYRPDTEIKKEMLADMRRKGLEPHYVVDDRNSVVAMWREAGITTLQCAEGDF